MTKEIDDIVNMQRFIPAPDPFIALGLQRCPSCQTELANTGLVKLSDPPLQVVQCKTCEREYWRRTTKSI